MKYKMDRIAPKNDFKPFSITFEFHTQEEYVEFHDKLAIKYHSAKRQ